MIIGITQARTTSTRLPNKILKSVGDSTILGLHMKRMSKSKFLDKHIIAFTENISDDSLKSICEGNSWKYYRGNEFDVLDRYYQTALSENLANEDIIVRLTSDCPLIDPELTDLVIDNFINHDVDYCSNNIEPTFPDGLDSEVIKVGTLKTAWKEAKLKSDREHVTSYIWRNSDLKGGDKFSAFNVEYHENYSKVRLTIDQIEDYLLIEELVRNLGPSRPWKEYADFVIEKKLEINSHIKRNQGYFKSLKEDEEF